MSIFERNLLHLLAARSWSTAELGRRLAATTSEPEAKSIRKARRMATGQQSPKLPDIENLAAIFQVAPADLVWLDMADALKDMSPLADLGVPRGCGSPAGRDARGGTLPGGSND